MELRLYDTLTREKRAFVPLDPAHPRQRLGWLLADSGARVVVASPSLAG